MKRRKFLEVSAVAASIAAVPQLAFAKNPATAFLDDMFDDLTGPNADFEYVKLINVSDPNGIYEHFGYRVWLKSMVDSDDQPGYLAKLNELILSRFRNRYVRDFSSLHEVNSHIDYCWMPGNSSGYLGGISIHVDKKVDDLLFKEKLSSSFRVPVNYIPEEQFKYDQEYHDFWKIAEIPQLTYAELKALT